MSNQAEKDHLAAEPAAEPAANAPAPDRSEAPAEEDVVAIEDLGAQLEAITAERDRLAAANEELKDRLLRRQADFENFRRRVEKERTELFQYASGETIRALLPILDDFERALQAAPGEDTATEEFVKGIEMIYRRFFDALKKLGLEPIESVGKPFDPNVHHAIETVPTTEAEDQTVLEELQKGYNFKGKLLREALVRVAVQPPSDSSSDDSK